MKDIIGDRIKAQYEDRMRIKLPRRSYTIIRIDGKAFHSYTKGLDSPFDMGFMEDMNLTAAYLCKSIMGAKFAFVQSDEISILLTDFETIATEAWFDGNVQKMCSVSASMTTAGFNRFRSVRYLTDLVEGKIFGSLDEIKDHPYFGLPLKWAEFDSRVFQIPDRTEVENYFIWRQNDTVRNSISSVAQTLYSHKELEGKNTNEQQEMIFQRGTNWNDYPVQCKRGRLIVRETYDHGGTERSKWVTNDPPTFVQGREIFTLLIPTIK